MAWCAKMPVAFGILLWLAHPVRTGQESVLRVESDSPRTSCALRVKGFDIDLPFFSVFAMPDELVAVEILDKDSSGFDVRAEGGTTSRFSRSAWIWRAPTSPGLYPMVVRSRSTRDSTVLNCFVMVPYSELQHGILNGYRIGRYPSPRDDSYERPLGFVEVTHELENAMLSPHFRLRDFLCRQPGDYPKYMVIRERLIVKLEYVIASLQEAGHADARIVVRNGYRTPYYNARTGNVAYSRHVWGDAADIYVDGDGDDRMDDLNGDGRINTRDARVLYDIIDALDVDSACAGYCGGLGLYGGRGFRTPFVHVDARGQVARWKTLNPGVNE